MDLTHITELSQRLEDYYDFQCEGGPLKNCVEWQQLKAYVLTLGRATGPPATEAHL